MQKHALDTTWPRWAGTVADLVTLCKAAVLVLPDGALQIEVHRRGLGTSFFATGEELTLELTIPDLARVDRVVVRVDRAKAQALSLVAITLAPKLPGVTDLFAVFRCDDAQMRQSA